jgi:hypothetical protein
MPEAAPVTSATLSLKDQFTNVSYYLMSSMITFTDPATDTSQAAKTSISTLYVGSDQWRSSNSE